MKIFRSVLCGALCVLLICCTLSVSDTTPFPPAFFGIFSEEKNVNQSFTRENYDYTSQETVDETIFTAPENENITTTSNRFTEEISSFEKETYRNTVADLIPKENDTVSLTALQNMYLNENTDTAILLNTSVKGALSSQSARNTYTFKLTERGALRYSLEYPKSASGENWVATLYQKYNSNGFDGEEKWRVLNYFETNPSKTEVSSPNIGLYKGEYCISITGGQAASEGTYTLKTDFSVGSFYEIECNDTISRYNEIYPDVPVKGSSSLLKDGTDNDWFMFRVNSPTTVNILFEHEKIESVSVNWRVVVYDSAGNEIIADNSSGSTLSLNSGNLGLSTGYYFIAVFGRVYSPIDYTLTVKRCNSGNFETEINNSFETANELLLNNQISGALISSTVKADKDIFFIESTEAGCLSLDFIAENGTDEHDCWRVSLCDISNNSIWQTIVSPFSPQVSSPKIGLDKGIYYIVIDNDGLYKNSSVYTLKNTFEKTDNWEREYNDAPNEANVIFSGKGIYGTVVNRETEFDEDYFVFELPKGAVVKAELKHDTFAGERNIFSIELLDQNLSKVQILDEKTGYGLVDSNGNPIYSFFSYQNTESVSARYVLSAGTYYIKLTSGEFSSDEIYNLNIVFE